jgi:ParB/RepB/Spo0J family partition protein
MYRLSRGDADQAHSHNVDCKKGSDMKKMPNNNHVQKRPVDKLRDHPRQRELFPDLSDEQLKELAADMEANGLQHPIEILPDGTIVAGHQRVRAARLLDWREIDAIVRQDLAAEGDTAVEAYLVRDNMLRRHLRPLGKARCVQAMIEIESGGVGSKLGWREFARLKRCIADQLGMTDRNVNRYLLVLKTPMVVQEAFDRGELTLTIAGRVALLYRHEQAGIAKRIADGESAKHVVKEALAKGKPADDGVGRPLRRLFGALEREVPGIKDRVHEMKPSALAKEASLLHDAKKMIDRMLRRAKRAS